MALYRRKSKEPTRPQLQDQRRNAGRKEGKKAPGIRGPPPAPIHHPGPDTPPGTTPGPTAGTPGPPADGPGTIGPPTRSDHGPSRTPERAEIDPRPDPVTGRDECGDNLDLTDRGGFGYGGDRECENGKAEKFSCIYLGYSIY